jgi:hypothetical protein
MNDHIIELKGEREFVYDSESGLFSYKYTNMCFF